MGVPGETGNPLLLLGIHPCFQFFTVSKDGMPLPPGDPVHRQTFDFFPATDRADVACQISGNVFPGVEPAVGMIFGHVCTAFGDERAGIVHKDVA